MMLDPDRITPVSQSLYEQTYGGSLICCMVMLVLYGMSVLQTYIYFLNYDRDRREIKAMVFTVWVLGTVHAIFVCHTVYHYNVLSYTRPMSLIDGEWSVYTASAIGVVVCFIVQIFFARMIYYITRNLWRVVLTAIFSILIVVQIVFGILLIVKLFQLWELPKLKGAVHTTMVPLFSVRVLSDAGTATTLCVVLWNTRTGFRRSTKLFNALIVYAINRFVLTTLVVIVQTIVLIVNPDSTWAMVIEVVSVHLYINSLLATLNSREHLRGLDERENCPSSIRIQSGTTHTGADTDGSTTLDSCLFDFSRGRSQADFEMAYGNSKPETAHELTQKHKMGTQTCSTDVC